MSSEVTLPWRAISLAVEDLQCTYSNTQLESYTSHVVPHIPETYSLVKVGTNYAISVIRERKSHNIIIWKDQCSPHATNDHVITTGASKQCLGTCTETHTLK